MSPQRAAIVEIVSEHPDGVAPADVARRLGKPGGTVQAAMWRMANDEQLVSVGGIYKLPPTIPTDEERQARRKELADAQSLPFPEGSEAEAMEP
jgi:hypothetical protein